MGKLDGKNILITGASQGLGREMASRFAREAAKIRTAYQEAIQRRYLWHEFGDLNLIL